MIGSGSFDVFGEKITVFSLIPSLIGIITSFRSNAIVSFCASRE